MEINTKDVQTKSFEIAKGLVFIVPIIGIFLIVLLVVFFGYVRSRVISINQKPEDHVVGGLTAPTPSQTPRIFKIETPAGFFRDDSINNVTVFAENKWEGELVPNPIIQIKQYPGIPTGNTGLSILIQNISDPQPTTGTAKPKDCSVFIKSLAINNEVGGKTIAENGTHCWFYGVEKVNDIPAISKFKAVQFSTANTSSVANNIAIDVNQCGEHALVVISNISTPMSTVESDKALEEATQGILKNIRIYGTVCGN